MTTDESYEDDRPIELRCAEILFQTYQYLSNKAKSKKQELVLSDEKLLTEVHTLKHLFTDDEKIQHLLENELRVVPQDSVSQQCNTLHLKIDEQPDIELPDSLFIFTDNPYMSELCRQLYLLFYCAQTSTESDQIAQHLDVIVDQYALVMQTQIMAPVGDYDQERWTLHSPSKDEEAIEKAIALSTAIASHALEDCMLLLRNEYQKKSMLNKLFPMRARRQSYCTLMKEYDAMFKLQAVHGRIYYIRTESYCEAQDFTHSPYHQLFPIDNKLIVAGAEHEEYSKIIHLLNNPQMKQTHSLDPNLYSSLAEATSGKSDVQKSGKDKTKSSSSNPWPYSYVPISLDELCPTDERDDALHIRAITGDDVGVEPLDFLLNRYSALFKEDETDAQLIDQHHALLKVGEHTTIDLATQYVEIEKNNEMLKFPALTMHAEMSMEVDPLENMHHMIEMAIASENPHFFIIGETAFIAQTKQFLLTALLAVKEKPGTKFYPQVIGLPNEVIHRISLEACEEAGYPSQKYFDGQ